MAASSANSSLVSPPLTSLAIDIKWEELFTDASWYQTKQKVHMLGSCFLFMGLALGVITELTRRRFTAMFIKEVYSLVTMAVLFTSLGVACLAKRTFKNDPDYLRSEGKKAVDDLRNNNPSHAYITVNYGRFFTNAHINQYLKVQIEKATNYDAFITFHGKQVLDDLNEENGELVKELFIHQFVNNAQAADQIEQSYREECLKFPGIISKIEERRTAEPIAADDVPLKEVADTPQEYVKDRADVDEPPLEQQQPTKEIVYTAPESDCADNADESSPEQQELTIEELASIPQESVKDSAVIDESQLKQLAKEIDELLNKQITYEEFTKDHGSEAISIFIQQLKDPSKSEYIEKLKTYFKTLVIKEMKLFYLQNMNALELEPDDFNSCVSKYISQATNYDDFIFLHSKEVLEALDPENSEQLEKLFSQHVLKVGLGVVQVQERYPEECVKFPRVLVETYQSSIPSQQKETFKSTSQEDRERYFRPAFLHYVATLDMNISTIQQKFPEECQLLSVDESLLKQHLLVKEVDKLLNKETTYQQFTELHGSEAISLFIKGLVDPKPYIEKLQDYFETLPYPEMNLFLSHNKKALKLTTEMRRSAISHGIIKSSGYGSVRKKIGPNKAVIQDIHENSQIPYLKLKFQAWIKGATFHGLSEYKDDFEVFNLSYPQARKTQLLRELYNPEKPLTFESLINKYGYVIFDEHLVDLNNPVIGKLLGNYLLENSVDFFLNEDNPYKQEMKVRKLISLKSKIGTYIQTTEQQIEETKQTQPVNPFDDTIKKLNRKNIRSLISQHMELNIKTLIVKLEPD